MDSMKDALNKAAADNPELKELLDQGDKNAKLEHYINKKAARQAVIIERDRKRNENIKKKIFVWRTKVHGMNFSMRCGMLFANDKDEAERLIKNRYKTDTILYLEEAPIEEELIEIGMYIE